MIFLLISFISGVLTVLAPCILPLLPVVVGTSASGRSKATPYIVVISLGISVIIFTYILKFSTAFIMIPSQFWAYLSGGIIFFFGLTLLFPSVWERLPGISRLSIGSNKILGEGFGRKSFWGDVLVGASLGPIFSSCSPTYFVILASVLPASFLLGSFYLLSYVIGLMIALLLVALLGERLVSKLSVFSDPKGFFKRGIGLLFIILGIAIASGLEKKLEVAILDSGYFDITKMERYFLQFDDGQAIDASIAPLEDSDKLETEKPVYNEQKLSGPKAPEIVSPSGFINTGLNPDGSPRPITISEFKDKKVVLLDIWTYSCINCQRTLPYIESWYEKYKDMGLVVIGLHTPEFAFEKVKGNVEDAVKKFGLTYPIVMDNDYATWRAYGNRYWPRKYLISADGKIVYDHIGEGAYEETEEMIQLALSELNQTKIDGSVSKPSGVVSYEPSKVKSPEIYFGSDRNQYLGNGIPALLGEQTLSLPSSINKNFLYLEGIWNFSSEFATNSSSVKIVFKYDAKNVYMVANSEKGITVTVYKDGQKEKTVFIKANTLYSLIEGEDYGEHTLEIDIPEAGLNVFTFTFG